MEKVKRNRKILKYIPVTFNIIVNITNGNIYSYLLACCPLQVNFLQVKFSKSSFDKFNGVKISGFYSKTFIHTYSVDLKNWNDLEHAICQELVIRIIFRTLKRKTMEKISAVDIDISSNYMLTSM